MGRTLIVVLFCLFSSFVFAELTPHFDLEMTAQEYERLIKANRVDEIEGEFEPIMKMGKKFFDWLKTINAERPEALKISLSSPQSQVGYPIESPRFSSPKIIESVFNQLKSELPPSIKKMVLGDGTISAHLEMSDGEFISWGLKINDVYSRASRWILQKPYLWAYAERRVEDIRGYYFLNQVPQLESKLKDWNTISEIEQSNLKTWLAGLCINSSDTEENCIDKFERTLGKDGNPLRFYQEYLGFGKQMWEQRFLISNSRSDIDWTAKIPSFMKMPFIEPESVEVKNFLKMNIEDEWKWGDWALQLNFVENGSDTAHINFVPGATPHVNGLGGNTITMDANQPLTEYNVRWTIRHEFGHTLGFPDCYIEFYDTQLQQMVSYQIDTSNLMCSRRGKLQEKHYEELKRVYFSHF